VWELVSDSELFARTAAADHLWTFVVPGTPVGLVGERRISLSGGRGRPISGAIVERIAMDPGRRLVTRGLKTEVEVTTTVEPLNSGICVLTYGVRGPSRFGRLDEHRETVARSLDRRLLRMSAYVTGQAIPPDEPQVWSPDLSDHLPGRVVVTGTVSAPPGVVWSAARIAGGSVVDRAAPRSATVATIPGTPAGEVGEQICIASYDPPFVEVIEVTAQEAGRSLAVRYLTAATPVDKTVTLTPNGDGTDVTITIEFVAVPERLADQTARMRHVADVFLRSYQQSSD